MPNIIPNPTEIKIDFIGFYYLLFILLSGVTLNTQYLEQVDK